MIRIRKHEPGKDLRDFMRVPHLVLEGEPNWVAPLDLLVQEQLTPSKNNAMIKAMGCTIYKTYRLFEKPLAQSD